MSSLSFSFLGYLQNEQMDKVALDFCKSSPYLREDYAILKRGLRIKSLNNRDLVDIIKQFVEIEETCKFQNIFSSWFLFHS